MKGAGALSKGRTGHRLKGMPVAIGRRREDPGDLVDLLLECHARIRSFVELARLAATRADVTPADVSDACARVERYFTQALPLHVRDEEESVLPRLRGRDAELDRALASMTEQHREHDSPLRALLAASADLRQAPADPAARCVLAAETARLARELDAHLSLEEAVVFPALRRLVPPSELAEAVRELRERRRV